jgi:2-phospho-L-lactate guanylyltransferase
LLLTPPDALTPAFGPDSCSRHLENAKTNHKAAEVVRVPSLAFDIDTVADLDALREHLVSVHGGAAHTRGALAQLFRTGS